MNVWKQFENLLPKSPMLIATVTAHLSNDRSSVSFPGGGTAIVIGQTVSVNDKAFIQNNIIQGMAPTLPLHSFDI